MIQTSKKETREVNTTVALDESGGHVMLTLRDGDGSFCQALSAADAGKLLCAVEAASALAACCEGDLTVDYNANTKMLKFLWHDKGRDCAAELGPAGIAVFISALKHYCALLMRTDKGV